MIESGSAGEYPPATPAPCGRRTTLGTRGSRGWPRHSTRHRACWSASAMRARRQSALLQHRGSGVGALALAPQSAPQLAPDPPVQVLPHVLDLGAPEVARPAPQQQVQRFDGGRHTMASPRAHQVFDLLPQPLHARGRHLQPRFVPPEQPVAEEVSPVCRRHPALVRVDLQLEFALQVSLRRLERMLGRLAAAAHSCQWTARNAARKADVGVRSPTTPRTGGWTAAVQRG